MAPCVCSICDAARRLEAYAVTASISGHAAKTPPKNSSGVGFAFFFRFMRSSSTTHRYQSCHGGMQPISCSRESSGIMPTRHRQEKKLNNAFDAAIRRTPSKASSMSATFRAGFAECRHGHTATVVETEAPTRPAMSVDDHPPNLGITPLASQGDSLSPLPHVKVRQSRLFPDLLQANFAWCQTSPH